MMSYEVSPARCDLCGKGTKNTPSVYVWFRKYVTANICVNCGYSKAICLMCKSSIKTDKISYYPILYIKHILGHYGLNVDYIDNYYASNYNLDSFYTSLDVYDCLRQLMFVTVEMLIEDRYSEPNDIKYAVKDKKSHCSICKQSGVDTFYEAFPSMEVIVSHLLKVHVDQSAVIGELPKLIDFVRNVNFK